VIQRAKRGGFYERSSDTSSNGHVPVLALRRAQARDNALIREVLEGLRPDRNFDAAIVALAAALKVIDDDQEARWNHLETQLAAIATRMTEL
jgi:hypothetical protein